MSSSAIRKSFRRPLAITAVGLTVAWFRLISPPVIVDDAYITLRYSANLARGEGLVYNPGEHVLGTSTPLYAALIGGLARLTSASPVLVATKVNALADGTSAALVTLITSHIAPLPVAALAALTLTFNPLVARYSIGGMELSVAVALLLAATYVRTRERSFASGVLATTALFVRAETLAIVAGLAVYAFHRSRRDFASFVLPVALGVAFWLVYSLPTFGSAIPQSIVAKAQGVYQVSPFQNVNQIAYAIGGLLVTAPTGIAAEGIWLYLPPPLGALTSAAAAVLVATSACGAVWYSRRVPAMVVLFGSALFIAFAYISAGFRGRAIAEWYLVILLPAVVMGVFAALAALHERGWRVFAFSSAIVLAMLQLSGTAWHRFPHPSFTHPLAAQNQREQLYAAVGQWLAPRLGVDSRVAAPEIGALGYFCRCRILDTVGLVSPEALDFYPLPPDDYAVNNAVPPALIRELEPDYLVTLDVFVSRSLAGDSWFTTAYNEIRSDPITVFGSRRLVVYRRRIQTAPPSSRSDLRSEWPRTSLMSHQSQN